MPPPPPLKREVLGPQQAIVNSGSLPIRSEQQTGEGHHPARLPPKGMKPEPHQERRGPAVR